MKNSNIIFPQEICTGCGACSASCPQKCIQMQQNSEGFQYPKIQMDLCIKCGICKEICPLNTTKYSTEFTFPSLFAAYHRNIIHRRQSTSGGAFAAIAEEVIAQGGVVFGTAFNNSTCTSVICRAASNEEELSVLKTSKYIQSDSSLVYAEIEKFLQKGQVVLFSGTPCQVAGVHTFFKKNPLRKQLYTCDLICHGVPSPLAWTQYLKWLSLHFKTTISDFQFRNKQKGWKNSLRSCVLKGKRIFLHGKEDSFSLSFYLNLSLRESCYHCPFDCASRADLTLADFWGIEKTGCIPLKEIRDGISRIEINTQHGQQLLSLLNSRLVLYPIQWDKRQTTRPERPLQRDIFYQAIKESWEQAFPLMKVPLLTRIRTAIREYLPEPLLDILRRI